MEIDNLPDDIVRDELTNIISVSTKYNKTTRGLGYDFFNCMQQHRNKIAQYIQDTGEVDTYGALLKRSIRTALHLRDRNLTQDDVVCLCSYNHLDSCVPFIASLFLEVPVASLAHTFTVSEAAHLIKLVKPKVLFVVPEDDVTCLCSYNHLDSCVPFIASLFLELPVASLAHAFTVSEATYLIKLVKPKVLFVVPEVIDMITESMEKAEVEAEIIVYGDNVDTDRFTPFNTFLEKHQEEDLYRPHIVKDVSKTAVIFFSSGTTGLPKAICSSHKAIYYQGFLTNYMNLLGPEAVLLLFSTLYWVSAVSTLSGCILEGAARLVSKSFNPEEVWYLIDKYKVTYVFLAPIQAYQMISAGRPEGIDTSNLYMAVTGGTSLSEDKLYEFRDLLPGTFVCQGYGSTEMSGCIAFFNTTKTKDKLLLNYRPTSSGRPVSGIEYKIVDLVTEKHCGPNERGELRLKSEFTLNGYYHQDSSSAFDSEGWLRTGDIVYYDEECCFYIVDRIKEMLKYRSWHVPPAILEGVLQTHPAVKQCVVIGVPHEVDGDHPMAVIVLHEAYVENVTAQEIENFVAERVNDTHKLRGGVKFIDVLPMTPSGKVKKKEIKEMMLNGLL